MISYFCIPNLNMKAKKEWFQDWFDTKYYHILYQDRNDEEAHLFMRNLVTFLNLKKGDKILDLPCGRGRHSTFLNSLGYSIIGADLSQNSINYAQQFENDSLKFKVHDMRDPFQTKFNAIFNLFTSFGYFDDEKTNINVLKNIKKGLKKNGVAVIDFLNVHYTKNHFVKEEVVTKNNIDFIIDRSVNQDYIIKNIRFKADGKDHHYTEYVRFLTLQILEQYIIKAGLKLKHIFGDYILNPFDIKNSTRLILILE